MTYQNITENLVSLAKVGTDLRLEIIGYKSDGRLNPSNPNMSTLLEDFRRRQQEWQVACRGVLQQTELWIEYYRLINIKAEPAYRQFGELSDDYTKIITQVNLLLEFAQNVEARQVSRSVVPVFIDDIDDFASCRNIKPADVEGFTEGAFLEDDVIAAFCERIGEPYSEAHSGSETRDLYTTRLTVGGKRLRTAAMFKGRGVNRPLRIKDCGSQGNQLLKLAKNTSAQLFIVQHVHKIDPEVEEALRDHVLSLTLLSTVYFCFIDGVDTARFLKGMNRDLAEMKARKSK